MLSVKFSIRFKGLSIRFSIFVENHFVIMKHIPTNPQSTKIEAISMPENLKETAFKLLELPDIKTYIKKTSKSKDADKLAFYNEDDLIFLLGQTKNNLCRSQYLSHILKQKDTGKLAFNEKEESELQSAFSELLKNKLIKSAIPAAQGGIFTALIISGMPNKLGFDIETDNHVRKDAFLFGESQSRIIVSVSHTKATDFMKFMLRYDTKADYLGVITKGDLIIDNEFYGNISDALKIIKA